MSRSQQTAERAVPMGRARTLARVYRRFGQIEAETSPLYGRIAVARSGSDEALRAEAIGRCWSQGRWLAWLADS